MKNMEEDRFQSQVQTTLSYLGTLKKRSTKEIEASNWLLGCETLDRDYADYESYKEYLCPLGIKVLRFQGGWAKTEKVRGVYEWDWLDRIIEDVCERGLIPWVQTSYGNPLYPGAGGVNLGAGMPLSEEGLLAYERWVRELVSRYCQKVLDWEVWNEPNFGDNRVNTPEITADFNIRTAHIIKSIQPEARISALALGHIDLEYIERFFKYLYEHKAVDLFHNVTYHDYAYNPDANKLAVYQMRQIVHHYAPKWIIRQGENGAPSVGKAGGALFDYPWTELSQAKWNLRRMLENLGNDIECSVFSIAEMQYCGDGPIKTKNTKGLLETAPDHRVLRPKLSYYAVQNVTALFDNKLERLRGVRERFHLEEDSQDEYWKSTDRSISVFGYQEKETKKRLYTLWRDDAIPSNDDEVSFYDFIFSDAQFESPVLVELMSGKVYEINKTQWSQDKNLYRITRIPIYDSPIIIADRSMILFDLEK